MKNRFLSTGIAAIILLAACASSAHAGFLSILGGPSFLPGSSFTQNTIDARVYHNPDGLVGAVARLYGDSMVGPAVEFPQSPRILLSGDFSANPGDIFTVVYDFTVNLNSEVPITITLGAQTIVAGVQQTFNTLITINPGQGHYSGQVTGPAFSLATSGTWKGHLYFNFSQGRGPQTIDPGNLVLNLGHVDFRLTAVPEPSSLAFLGIGLVALAFFARRRRQAA